MFPYQDIIHGIDQLMAQEIPFLLSLSEEQVSTRRNRQQRTVKMLVGHLIDSASNNHQRLVRLQYAPRCGHSMPATEMGMLVFPDYTQDNDLWLQLQDYQHEDWQTLASRLGIHYHCEPLDAEVPYFLAQELIPGYLSSPTLRGRKRGNLSLLYTPPRGYFAAIDQPEAFAAYEAIFPPKEKKVLPTQLFPE